MPGTSHPRHQGLRSIYDWRRRRDQTSPANPTNAVMIRVMEAGSGTAAMSANTRMQPLGQSDPATAPPAGTKTSPEIGSTATECAPLEVGMSWKRLGVAVLKSITPTTRDVATSAFVSPVP